MTTFLFPFQFNATIYLVHDGDTIWVRSDRGMRDYSDWIVRLAGVSARELREPGGPEARDYVAALLPVDAPVGLKTVHPDKYGSRAGGIDRDRRVVDAYVTYLRADGMQADLSTDLILTGWAAPWDGNGIAPKPVWPRIV